jgi:hypothetical protein
MDGVVKLLAVPSNFAVVQLPGRRFPGVVMQGDTLSDYVTTLSEVLGSLDETEQEEAYFEVLRLKEQLENALDHYEQVCSNNGIELPYVRKPK